MGADGVPGGGGHGGPHVVGVGDPLVHHPAYCDVGDVRARAFTPKQDRSRPGDRPLGGGGALAAVFQRGAVLALGGAEVGAGGHRRLLAKAAVQHQGGQGEALAHGGAGPIQAEEGQAVLPGGEGGADALVQQVPGKEKVGPGSAGWLLGQSHGQGFGEHGPL